MSISHTIKSVCRDGDDLILKTVDNRTEREQEFVIKDASIEPMKGDYMHFPGTTATALPDGSLLGGGGFIAMDGNEFPYRRVGYGKFVEAW